jgi:peptidoglycan L-alanyl-D-glutamate endopeptidase CwlK
MARDLKLLHPTARKKAEALIEAARKKGITVIVCQTLRTKAEQEELYAQGRTKPGLRVTKARYPESLHCWGVAFDICVIKNGEADYKDIAAYNTIGKLGEAMGLGWGGAWENFLDRPHYELPGYNWKVLRAKYGTPEKFIATWPKEADEVIETKVKYKGKNLEAHIHQGKTFVELRELAQACGKKVIYDDQTKTSEVKD